MGLSLIGRSCLECPAGVSIEFKYAGCVEILHTWLIVIADGVLNRSSLVG